MPQFSQRCPYCYQFLLSGEDCTDTWYEGEEWICHISCLPQIKPVAKRARVSRREQNRPPKLIIPENTVASPNAPKCPDTPRAPFCSPRYSAFDWPIPQRNHEIIKKESDDSSMTRVPCGRISYSKTNSNEESVKNTETMISSFLDSLMSDN